MKKKNQMVSFVKLKELIFFINKPLNLGPG
mgnify:FL=1